MFIEKQLRDLECFIVKQAIQDRLLDEQWRL
jgi:hypothetical protein